MFFTKQELAMNPELHRRRFLARTLPAAAIALGLPLPALAQVGTARIVNGYPAGGILDVVSRKLAEHLSGAWGRNVIVDNKPGAAGRLAVEALVASPPDGSSMLVTPASVVTMYPHIYKNLSYDVFSDLAPVGIVAVAGFALAVGPAVPASVRTLDEFFAWCKLNPAAAQCGNAGAGSFPHFMAMLLAREARVTLPHVPYRGGLAAMQDAAAGQVSAALATEASAIALERAGKLRVLATTGSDRSVFLPQAPTFREMGYPNLAQREWFAAFMPARTPAAVIALAADGIQAALREPGIRDVWHKAALSAEGSTPAELRSALRKEHDFWGPVIKASGFTPEA
jgi:tripartite-type tricarboxylate transporter receptor subunit TctC